MTIEPYTKAQRVFVVIEHGSAHRGQRSIDRLPGAWPNLTLVHTPVHASWVNQAEIYFSVAQRKVRQPNNFPDLDTLEQTLLGRSAPTTSRSLSRSIGNSPAKTSIDSWNGSTNRPHNFSSPHDLPPIRQRIWENDH